MSNMFTNAKTGNASAPGFHGGIDWSRILGAIVTHPLASAQRSADRFAQAEVGGQGFRNSLHALLSPSQTDGFIQHASAADSTTPAWQQQGYANQAQYSQDNGIGNTDPGLNLNSNGRQGEIPAALPPGITTNTNPSGSHGGGGSINVPVTFMGKQYSGINDPHLHADKLAYFTKQHNEYAKSLEDAYKSGLISFEERRHALDQNRQSILDQQTQWKKDYANNLTGLATGRDTGIGAVQASFSQASPDVVQSSQADYTNKVLDQYNTGVGQLNDTNAANTKNIDQNLQNIGTSGDAATAGTAYGDLAQNRANYDTQYANNLAQNDQALTGQQDQQANDLANYQAQQSAAAGQAAGDYQANIKQVDSNQLLSGLAATTSQMQSQGFSPQEIQASLQHGLRDPSLGLDPSQIDPLLNFFYGNFLPRYTASQTAQ